MSVKKKPQARRRDGRRKSKEKFRDDEVAPRGRPRSKLNVYLSNHWWSARATLQHIWAAPLSALMTISVIAIALALPTGLYVLLKNVQEVSTAWESSAQISLFLKPALPEVRINQLQRELQSWEEQISTVQYIPADQALAEFKRQSGFGDALDILNDNPLPPVLVVQPAAGAAGPPQIEALLGRLRAQKGVDQAILDMQWVRRLSALLAVGERGVMVLATLLAIAILLVVGNTIRLTIFNRREEILVNKLIGATDPFIRRPFLYAGFWYGLLGAALAWLLVLVALGLLKTPINTVAVLYDSQFTVRGLDGSAGMGLLAGGVLLGLLGSRLAVGRHLRAIEPE
jgi:cell division transport system permease protein